MDAGGRGSATRTVLGWAMAAAYLLAALGGRLGRVARGTPRRCCVARPARFWRSWRPCWPGAGSTSSSDLHSLGTVIGRRVLRTESLSENRRVYQLAFDPGGRVGECRPGRGPPLVARRTLRRRWLARRDGARARLRPAPRVVVPTRRRVPRRSADRGALDLGRREGRDHRLRAGGISDRTVRPTTSTSSSRKGPAHGKRAIRPEVSQGWTIRNARPAMPHGRQAPMLRKGRAG